MTAAGISDILPALYPALSWDDDCDKVEDHAYWQSRVAQARAFLDRVDESLLNYNAYCAARNIIPDDSSVDTIRDTRGLCCQKLERLETLTATPQDITDHRLAIENAMRNLHQLRVVAARSAAWVCEAYEQSSHARAFNAASFAVEIKYDRYESGRVRDIEAALDKVTSLGEGSALLATSFGMAAYHMADAYLRAHILRSGDTVLVAHGLYSEVTESMLKGFDGRIMRVDLYDADAILDTMEESNASAVYLDPMKNRLEMRMCDVDAVIAGWQARHPERPMTFIVDGTMTTGLDKTFDAVQSDKIEILYYSSCCKYLQLGQDVVSGGFLAFPARHKSLFENIRRATGAILYDSDAWAYPDVKKRDYDWRLGRLSRNALVVGATINDDDALDGRVEAVYPGLPGHPDFALGYKTGRPGGLLTFRFNDTVRASHQNLNIFVHDFMVRAKADHIDIINGESFGFGVPRIYVGWTPNNDFPPFLRLSAGDRPLSETRALARLLGHALAEFTAPSGPSMY